MKEKQKKKLFVVLAAMFVVTLLMAFGNLFPPVYAIAETGETIEEKCERYTSSDKLINDNSRDLEHYAEELNGKRNNESVTDLDQVIPAEYLRHNGTEAVYRYIGAEYGFLVVHSTHMVPYSYGHPDFGEYHQLDYVHVFLFDFTWKYENNQQIMRIDVLSNVDLIYSTDGEGNDVWTKADATYSYVKSRTDVVFFDFHLDFYLQNVAFQTLLLNENKEL